MATVILPRDNEKCAFDPDFYRCKKELREQFPNAALIEILPETVTLVSFESSDQS